MNSLHWSHTAGLLCLTTSSPPLPDELGILQGKHLHYLGSSIWHRQSQSRPHWTLTMEPAPRHERHGLERVQSEPRPLLHLLGNFY